MIIIAIIIAYKIITSMIGSNIMIINTDTLSPSSCCDYD